jgi:S-formylglutathione hydrolase FrmB
VSHAPLDFRGRVEFTALDSEVLRGNALGDPHTREVPVYVPPGADGRELPLLTVLAGYTGDGRNYFDTHPWRRGIVWKYDRAVAAGEAAPAILVVPNCFTRLGGSQYVNSSATGRYLDHVVDEVLPFVEERYPVLTGRRGVLGKSSGGIGALHLVLERPGTFAACASISGDCGFDALCPPEFHGCLRGLVPHGGDPARFLAAFRADPRLEGDAHAVIIVLAMAACYSPNPDAALGFDLPFDLETGELVDEVWQRWLAFDPLVRLTRDDAGEADALRALDLLHLECGLADEYNLQWGLRRLVRRLRELDVPHVHEEHAGGHRGIDERWTPLLGRMAEVLAG